jgi:hypothetical protein
MTADEQVVHVAEAVVGQAWAVELTRHHDEAAFTVRAAEEACENARRRLDSAQGEGDPRGISLAHARLERTLNLLRESEVAYEQIRTAAHFEFRLLARTTGQRVLTELADEWEAATPWPPLQNTDPPDAELEQASDKALRSRRRWLWRRIPERLLGLVTGRIRGTQQS